MIQKHLSHRISGAFKKRNQLSLLVVMCFRSPVFFLKNTKTHENRTNRRRGKKNN